MRRVETRGGPFERGSQQGKACADLARLWMDRALAELARKMGCDSVRQAVEGADAEVSRFRLQTERVVPEAVEECCGIAAGMGLDERTYFTAVMAWQLNGAGVACSLLGWCDQLGRPIFAKTDDIAAHELGSNVLQIARPDRGHPHVALHFAGTIWTVAGMNEAGLAMGMTGIPGPAVDADGCSSLVALHAILPACATVDQAIAGIGAQRINHYGYSLMLADARGRIALVEKNAAGMAVVAAHPGGFWAHTNHLLDPQLKAASPEQVEPVGTNGVRRLARIQRLAPSLTPDEQGLAAFLSDRRDEGAIWQEGGDGLFTDFGVIFLPYARRMRFWTGHPAKTQAQTVDLGTILRPP